MKCWFLVTLEPIHTELDLFYIFFVSKEDVIMMLLGEKKQNYAPNAEH